MATFEEHLAQAKSNIAFLEHLSSTGKYIDWQITACFYVAVHLANAHIAKQESKNFRAHIDVTDSLNPFNDFPSKVSEPVFISFQRLHNLSRKARYLVPPMSPDVSIAPACYAAPKHLITAVQSLDVIIQGFKDIHRFALPKIQFTSSEFFKYRLKHFDIASPSVSNPEETIKGS